MGKSRITVLLIAFLIVACGGEQVAQHGAENPHLELAWFEGTVDEAFALAAREGRPVFLYWGAEWCPPCHYLKNKIFKRPEFVAKMADFIPVYLDGDTERAQILGEDLKVKGYPTVIVFSPDGDEVMRMPSSIPAAQYADVLDAAVQVMRPLGEVVEEVRRSGAAAADPASLNLLAFYSWGQDAEIELAREDVHRVFGDLYRETPAELAAQRSRFFSHYLDALIDLSAGDESEAAPELSAEEKQALAEQMQTILTDADLRNSNLFPVFYRSRRIVEFLFPDTETDGGGARAVLVDAWLAAARQAEDDEALSVDDRLSALLPQIQLARMEGEEEAELPEALVGHLRDRIAWAGEAVSGSSELQAVMSTMAWLLEQAGLEEEAETLLAERMGDTAAPYYYMSWLAGLKAEADRPEEALTLYRQAYDSARGRYTRFRWGSTYLRRLLELSPDDTETITAASGEILDELLTHGDAFALGNHSRLQSLEKAYREWNEDGSHAAELDGVRKLVQAACGRYPEQGEDSQRARCESFLS